MIKTDSCVQRPIVRYFGGKWVLAKWIISQFPKHRVYVEPFGGGGSVLLQKERSYAEVYNDLDSEMTNLFEIARDRGSELKDKIYYTPFSRADFMQSYKPTPDPLERARRTIIKSYMGFGGNAISQVTGFRSNSNRSGTTPAHDWKNYFSALDGIIERLRGVIIENRGAISCMEQHDSEYTLHYVDPPYVHETRGKNRYRLDMTEKEHIKLAEFMHQAKGMVVISGYNCQLYEDLYKDFLRVEKRAFADGARERIECLWLNHAVEAKQEQNELFTS